MGPSLAAAVLTAALLLAACGEGGDESAGGAPPPRTGDPGPIHVHGLGVNPADGALFIATHTGLFRAAEGQRRAERVAGRFQDTMGFTVTGPDRFLGSGHPDLRDDLPSFLGLIESRDAGESWKPISLLGQQDFHVLEAAGRRIYGFGTDLKSREATLLVSSDGGRSWEERPPPEGLMSLAIDPRNPDRIVASGSERAYASANGGTRWQELGLGSALLAWPASRRLVAVGGTGRVAQSSDSGETWRRLGQIGGAPAAFESSGRDLYVALHDGTVKRSRDGGRNWTVRSLP